LGTEFGGSRSQDSTSWIACETEEAAINDLLNRLWRETDGQDVAEYAIMLAVVLVIVTGMVRLIGTNASAVFSAVGSAIQ
jgi:Flp pilus assembly pilin Flp